MYGCSSKPWWFLALGSVPLLFVGMVLSKARRLALRLVALHPDDHWWIWSLVLKFGRWWSP